MPAKKPPTRPVAARDRRRATRVGIKQIAQALQLGTSTVAYALAGNGTISDETRQRVLRHAAEVGYVPDRNARRTGVVGLVVPDVVLNYNETVQHVFRHVIERGDEVQIALTEFDAELEDRALTSMLESRVDGILLKSCFERWDAVPPEHALRRAVAAKVPVVLWSRPMDGCGLPALHAPYEEQARQLIEHLLGLGRRRLALCLPTGAARRHPAHAAHIAGAAAAVAEAGLPPEALRVLDLDDLHDYLPDGESYGNYIDQSVPRLGLDCGRQMLDLLLAADPKIDGVVMQSDLMGIGALREARRRGIEVPRALSVAVIHRTVAAELSPLTLTHSRIEPRRATQTALDLMYKLIAAAEETAEPSEELDALGDVTVTPQLVAGESSVCPR